MSTRGQYFLSPHRTIMRDLKLGTWPRKKNGTALAWQTAKKQNSMYKSLSPSVLCCRVRAGRLAADPAAYGVKGAGLLPILLEETLGDLRAAVRGPAPPPLLPPPWPPPPPLTPLLPPPWLLHRARSHRRRWKRPVPLWPGAKEPAQAGCGHCPCCRLRRHLCRRPASNHSSQRYSS